MPDCNTKDKWTVEDIFENKPHAFVVLRTDYHYRSQLHTHEFYEINFIFHGSSVYYLQDSQTPVGIGDVTITPPDVYHKYRMPENNEMLSMYNLCIRKEFFTYYQKQIATVPTILTMLENAPYSFQIEPFLHLNVFALTALKNDLDLIADCYNQKIENGEYMQNLIALKVLVHLAMLFETKLQSWSADREKSNFAAIVNATTYVRFHFDQKLTIDMLAEQAHMSRSSFIRHFQSIYHCSPMEYVRSVRIKHAKSLIKTSSASKTAIAQRCGFYDVSHMEKYL